MKWYQDVSLSLVWFAFKKKKINQQLTSLSRYLNSATGPRFLETVSLIK